VSRSIRAAAVVRPAWRAGGVRVQGPDEDAFTLAVDALEQLRRSWADRRPPGRIDLVGEFPDGSAWGVGEALGLPSVEVRVHPPGPPSLFAVLGSPESDPGPTALVAVDTARPAAAGPDGGPPAAAAVAIGVADGPGAPLLGHSSRSHPPERRPHAEAWVSAARQAVAAADPSAPGRLVMVADGPPPVLLAAWAKALPAWPATVLARDAAEEGRIPTVRPLLALRDSLNAVLAGTPVVLAVVQRERTDFLGVAHDGPVDWAGPWAGGGPTRPAPGDRPFAERADLRAVSEGAYVPRPRYVENLPSRWRFAADRCAACAEVTFPTRGYCRHCGRSDARTPIELPMDDLPVEAKTVVAAGAQPTEFDPQVSSTGAYGVVLVRLADGVRATLQVTDADPTSIGVGDRVSTRLRRLYPMEGAWRYGRKAVPADPSGAREGGAAGASHVVSSQLS
jgi:uncharacterized OB-fold protein